MRILSVVVLLTLLSISTASTQFHTPSEYNEEEWYPMPNGKLYHIDCIHHHDDDFHVQTIENGEKVAVTKNFEVKIFDKCPHEARTIEPTAEAYQYYSDWSVYASTTQLDNLFSYQSAQWEVPPAPKSHGPAYQSSVYFFNGLEDGGGVHGKASMIMQPVLSFGKSGCVIDPLFWGEWHMIAFLVEDSGRAHCGSRLRVHEGDTVYGEMQLTDADSHTWNIVAKSLTSNKTSTYSVSLSSDITINAAYLTLEGMIIYSCQDYPEGNGTLFSKNELRDGKGNTVSGVEWKSNLRHGECGQKVTVKDNGDVMLEYFADN